MDMTFTEADRSNIETLLDMMREYYDFDHIRYDRKAAGTALECLLAAPSLGRAWLIRSGDNVVGYCVLTFGYSLEFRGRFAVIDELFIREGHRRRGIGRRALAFLAAAAGELGAEALRLEVERKNGTALRLYRKEGFMEHDRLLMTRVIDRG